MYHTRVVIVALFMCSLALLIGIGSLFPSYMTAYTEEQAQLDAVRSLKDTKDATESARIQKELKADNAHLTVLETVAATVRPSHIITRLLEVKGQVLISSLVITEMSSTTATVIIQGVAPTRESLVAFKTRLEGLSLDNKVDLPIAGFARSKDLPFSLKVLHHLP